MNTDRKPLIAIIGGGECSPQQAELIAETAKKVAKNGGNIVCGGLGGTMEAAARGVREGGGLAIGILPGSSKSEANSFIDVALPTGIGEARNVLIVRAADAIIAFEGKYGTLSEISFAMVSGKPVIAVSAWKDIPEIIQVESPDEAARVALQMARESK